MPDSIKKVKSTERKSGTASAGSDSSDLLSADAYTKCNDCGKFVKKREWVPKNHPWKKHALCSECFSNYDGPEY